MARKGENIYKRRDGRWEGRFIRGKRPNGKPRYVSVYGKSYADVKALLVKKKAETVTNLPACTLTVSELLAKWTQGKLAVVKQSSYERYKALVENHILPQLGGLRVGSLTAQILNSFIEGRIRWGRLDGTGGLSPKTVFDIVVILRSALRAAQKKYAIPETLFEEVKAPAVRQKRVEVMGEHETIQFTSAALAASSLSSAAYLLGLNAGLRLGELCSLRWSDINFQEATLHIARTVLRINTGLIQQPPKSEAADRIVPLAPEMLALLARLREDAPDDAFVLTASDQRPMEPRTLQYRFKSFLRANGLPPRNFHSLRHSFASRCIACGMDPKTLSEILGHSSVRTTLQLYVHPSMEQKRTGILAANTLAA